MIAAAPLGSFVVNLGQLARIPCGEGRLFRIGGHSITIFHRQQGSLESSAKLPIIVNEDGDILIGIEGLLAARATKSL
jgi:hypothetical protein